MKFKQVDGLLDQGPGGEISICLCNLLIAGGELTGFLIIVFLSIISDGKMHYYGFALWVLRPQKSLHPKKEPTHGQILISPSLPPV